ncbi:MAG TPA: hypothetical protein VK692_01665, partial [Chthoniobacterales bacterium]|nr:hypothetical protein [Chthoniobacterales bacterium]
AASTTAVDFTEAALELPDFTGLPLLTLRRAHTPAHSADTVTAALSTVILLADNPASEAVPMAEAVFMGAAVDTDELTL